MNASGLRALLAAFAPLVCVPAVCAPAVCALVVLAGSPAHAETETGVALRQNALTAGWLQRPAGVPLPGDRLGLSETRMRTWLGQTWSGQPWGETRLQAALELQTGFSSAPNTGLGLIGGGSPAPNNPFEIIDLTWDGGGTAQTRARIERLDARWSLGALDVDLGRQPISLGTSHFVGVLDVLSPFAPGALDASYKPGVDALRARTALGETGEAELILAGSDPWNQGGSIARLRTSLAGMDIELLGGRFRNRHFGGLGWEGELGPTGVWGEVALFQRRPDVETLRGGWDQAAFSGVVGTDFKLPFEIHGGAALMVQDFGARRPEDLASVMTDAPYQEGWAFLGSQRYGVLTASKQLHPLINGSLAGILNLVDGSTLWQPRATLSVSDNSDLGVYGWIGTGTLPHVDGASVTPGSEFGMVPTGLGIYARWFF